MIKLHRIVIGTTLLAALTLVMVVWAHAMPAPSRTRAGADSVRAVKLRLTFAAGDAASVTQVEGGTITIEKDGKKLAITPYIRDHGRVELRVFEAVQREGKEVMQTLDTLLVDKNSTKLDRGSVPLSVQVVDANKTLSATILAAANPGTCCARTCAGTLICGVCVCTDCSRCGPGWCDCAMP